MALPDPRIMSSRNGEDLVFPVNAHGAKEIGLKILPKMFTAFKFFIKHQIQAPLPATTQLAKR